MVSTTGKIAVITGGSAGIDLGTAKQSDLDGFPLSSGRAGRGLRTTVALGAVIVATGLGLWAYANFTATPVRPAVVPPPSVAVATPVQANVADRTDLTGQFSAVNQVVLRAQVGGYLTEIHFKDGQIMRKGDLLFVIDPRPYEIQFEQAVGQLQQAQANRQLQDVTFERQQRLRETGVIAKEDYDTALSNKNTAAAQVVSAEAAIHAAQLNIEFTHIVAPFSGRVSRRHVSIGSLITGGPGATSATELTTIVSLDPIYLDFDLSEVDYAAYQHSAAARPSGANAVQISLDGERPWARTGDLDFLDNQIDRRSGTLHARATLANPDLAIAAKDNEPIVALTKGVQIHNELIMLRRAAQKALRMCFARAKREGDLPKHSNPDQSGALHHYGISSPVHRNDMNCEFKVAVVLKDNPTALVNYIAQDERPPV